jgi:hypothetical protein
MAVARDGVRREVGMARFEPVRQQGGAARIASIGVLLAMIAAGGLLLRHSTYSGIVFGSSVPSTGPSVASSASTLSKVCSELPRFQLARVQLMQSTIASLRTDKAALLSAGDTADAAKVAAVISAAAKERAALKTGADTTTQAAQLSTAIAAVPC